MSINRRNFLKSSTGAALMTMLVPGSLTMISCKQTKNQRKMEENTLTVVAVIETSADRAEELKSVCLGLIEPTRKEDGCISYDLYQDNTNPGKFTFIENWQSQENLDVHLKTPHLVAAGEAFDKILTKDMVLLMLNKLT